MSVQPRVTVDTAGFNAMLRRVPPALRKEVRRALRRTIGPKLVRAVRRRTRVDTGRLRRSAYSRLRHGLALELGYTASYARFVEGPPIGDDVLGTVVSNEQDAVESALQAAVDRAAAKVSRR